VIKNSEAILTVGCFEGIRWFNLKSGLTNTTVRSYNPTSAKKVLRNVGAPKFCGIQIFIYFLHSIDSASYTCKVILMVVCMGYSSLLK
jgi:hypothetical protein